MTAKKKALEEMLQSTESMTDRELQQLITKAIKEKGTREPYKKQLSIINNINIEEHLKQMDMVILVQNAVLL